MPHDELSARYRSQVPYSWEVRKKYQDLPFPRSEYQDRLKKLRKLMADAKVDFALIFGNSSDFGDVVYIANFIPFGSTAAILVPKEGAPTLITDAILHGEPINSYAWTTWIEDFLPVHHDPREFASALGSILKGSTKVGIIGYDHIPLSLWKYLEVQKSQWTDLTLDFLKVKSIRSNREISLQREVGKITAEAMRAACEAISPGRSESEIAAVAYKRMFELGAHDRSFQTIVNSGPRGGLKHSHPTNRKIQRGDLIYLDMGAMKYGYQTDMSRSVVVGGASKEQKEVLEVVLKAYHTLTAMMKPGVRTSKLIEKAHQLEISSGLQRKYKKRMYLGLIVHHAIATSFFEFPSLGLPDTILAPNMSFAFEPMAHILDFGTAVVEDTLLITKKGAESLTPYELVHW